MRKFKQIVKFIKKYRKIGIASFNIITNDDTIIIYVVDKEKDIDDQIRIKYS